MLTDQEYRDRASQSEHEEIEVDPGAEVSRAEEDAHTDSPGAWVHCWVWVPAD